MCKMQTFDWPEKRAKTIDRVIHMSKSSNCMRKRVKVSSNQNHITASSLPSFKQ